MNDHNLSIHISNCFTHAFVRVFKKVTEPVMLFLNLNFVQKNKVSKSPQYNCSLLTIMGCRQELLWDVDCDYYGMSI